MRWQYRIFHEEEGGTFDTEPPDKRTLSELYAEQAELERRIDELRAEEPANKRKYQWAHTLWFSRCQKLITELQELRDKIVLKKEADGV